MEVHSVANIVMTWTVLSLTVKVACRTLDSNWRMDAVKNTNGVSLDSLASLDSLVWHASSVISSGLRKVLAPKVILWRLSLLFLQSMTFLMRLIVSNIGSFLIGLSCRICKRVASRTSLIWLH